MPFASKAEICSKGGEAFKVGDCVELPPVCTGCKIKDRDADWYDEGPGSEKFKREIRQSNLEFMKKNTFFPFNPVGKRIKHKKNGKNLTEMIEAISAELDANTKLSPSILISKGLLDEAVKAGRRLLRYVEELEK